MKPVSSPSPSTFDRYGRVAGAGLGVLALLASGCAAPSAPTVPRPTAAAIPSTPAGDGAARDLWLIASSCAGCHDKAFAEWRSSRHAAASTNELFVASFGLGSPGWCLKCHAPLPEQKRELLLGEPGRGLLADGIGCASCHLREGRIVSAHAPTEAGLAAHPMLHDETLATAEHCATCHQFDSPDLPHLTPGGLTSMQNTLEEWKASGRSGPCQSCHMGTSFGHRMPGGHDRALVRGTVTAEVAFSSDKVAAATLRSTGAGHAVPTGDPFRRFRLRLCRDEACIDRVETFWAVRRFERDGGVVIHGEDSRIPVPGPSGIGERRFEYESDEELPATLYWELDYILAEPHVERSLPSHLHTYRVSAGRVSRSP